MSVSPTFKGSEVGKKVVDGMLEGMRSRIHGGYDLRQISFYSYGGSWDYCRESVMERIMKRFTEKHKPRNLPPYLPFACSNKGATVATNFISYINKVEEAFNFKGELSTLVGSDKVLKGRVNIRTLVISYA